MKVTGWMILGLSIVLSNCQNALTKEPQIADPWENLTEILQHIQAPTFPDEDFLVTEFGAQADGASDDLPAFRLAIEKCHADGGGRVVVPEGDYFLQGPIHLKSGVNLYLAEGATVRFSVDPNDYLPSVFTRWEGVECMNYSPLIYAFEQENIAITGSGTFDGQANETNWWPWKGRKEYGWKEGMPSQLDPQNRDALIQHNRSGTSVSERVFGDGHYLRPNFVQPYRCKNVLIEGVTFKNSPMWILNPVLCENVTVDGVSVISHGPNNDGCDPESCKNVLVRNCFFDTGDDCIALKSGRNQDGRRLNAPIENVVIQNCRMKDGHGGVVIGSEVSGGARNIFAENCQMDSPNLDRAIRVKTNRSRGGVIENLFFRNITVGEVKEAVVKVNMRYTLDDTVTINIPTVRNIFVEEVASKKSTYGVQILGYDENPPGRWITS